MFATRQMMIIKSYEELNTHFCSSAWGGRDFSIAIRFDITQAPLSEEAQVSGLMFRRLKSALSHLGRYVVNFRGFEPLLTTFFGSSERKDSEKINSIAQSFLIIASFHFRRVDGYSKQYWVIDCPTHQPNHPHRVINDRNPN